VTLVADIVELREGRVVHLLVNRPEHRNTVTWQMWRDLATRVARLGDDANVLVLGSTERPFLSGGDLDELGSLSPEDRRLYYNDVEAFVEAVELAPYPVVGRVDGACVGAGLVVVLMCARVVATSRARFAMPGAKAGVLGDPRLLARVAAAVGLRTARSLMFGATVDSARAAALGIVDDLCEPAELDSKIAQVTAKLAELDQRAVSHNQRVLGAISKAYRSAVTPLDDKDR
jgi:enoyl-CoA hydratase/carnithine racemase